MKYILITLALLAGGLASGCAGLQNYKDAAIAAAKDVNDAEAEILTKGGCTVDLAAWGRLENIRVQDGYFYACVPESVSRRYGVSVGPAAAP